MKRACIVAIWLTAVAAALAAPVKVEVRESAPGRFELWRDGAPYYVRGAGGTDHLERLVAAGGNSIRTWGTDQTDLVLDAAQRLGLTVCVGLWIEHESHGFDYNDATAVRAQIARHCRDVDRLKDNPALLLWGVGNEVELFGHNPAVWDTVEAVAAYIKRVDPAHPVMTVTAHPSAATLAEIERRCPSIDLLGCNSYGPLAELAGDLRARGWQRPYLVTEWGVTGTWESEKTSWGAEIEPTSTEKARQVALRYARILADRDRCLGSYAFLWGQKQEGTATWFGLFLEDGTPIESVDVLQFLWSARAPASPAPQISPLRINSQPAIASLTVAPRAALHAEFVLIRGDDAAVNAGWEVLHESAQKGSGGAAEPTAAGTAVRATTQSPSFDFAAPAEPGAYRLFLRVRTSGETAATANFPFLVK